MGDSLANRPAVAANGTLAKTPVLHLLLYMQDKKLTGTIEFIAADKSGTASVSFIGGEPAKVRTSTAAAYLGAVLRDLGFLTEDQLTRSLADLQAAKTSGRAFHGQMLLEQRLIDRAKLEAGLREQLTRKLVHVASMAPTTIYGFYDGFDGLNGWGMESEQGFDPSPMYWRILCSNPPVEHVAAGLSRMGSSQLRLSKTADVSRFALQERERAAVEILRSHLMRMADMPSASGMTGAEAHLLFYLMLITKQIEIVRVPGEAPSPASSALRSRSSMNMRAVVPSVRSMPAASGTQRAAPLSQPPSRPILRPSPPSGRPAAAPVPPPPPMLAPELASRWHEIAERASTIERADYFTMLDVTRDASTDTIESAFLALAKKWHPDRLPGELAPVREACSKVFARMSEARSTLVDEVARIRYMGLLADGSGSPESQDAVAKVIEAATDFQKAEVCFRRNDLGQAEMWCIKAVTRDPSQAAYHALLAWLVALKPESQTPEKTAECIKRLDRAISMNQRAEQAYYWRGMLNQRLGKSDAALRDFKVATELNPRNIDAAREVRLHQMRSGRTSSPPRASSPPRQSSRPSRSSSPPSDRTDRTPKPGLLNRLFKK